MHPWLRNDDPTRPPLYDRVPLDELQRHFSGDSMIPLEWIAVAGGLIMLLPTPLTLLMSPATLRHHAAGFTESFGAGRTARVNHHIERVAQRIFAPDAERGVEGRG